jgi:mono/diheme cytochrome c family protein
MRFSSDSAEIVMKHVIALIATLACVAGAARAQEAGNPVKGAAIARQVCAECHAVERGQRPSPNGESPAFETIARTPGMTSIALTAALRTSHRRMPNIILPDDALKDVVAYVLTLK